MHYVSANLSILENIYEKERCMRPLLSPIIVKVLPEPVCP